MPSTTECRRRSVPSANSLACNLTTPTLLGNALAEQNKLAEAVPFYLTALKLNSANCQTEFNLGLTFARLGKRDEAAEHYRTALRINPNYPEAQTALRQLQSTGAPSGARNP
jgi:tetratricopeptide (TPR) repeat protein